MGRPSKITERQRAEILRRLALGEKPGDLRQEFKLSETTFRRNFSAGASKVRKVGTALAEAELALANLPVSAQISARTFADRLKQISLNLGEAADLNSASSVRLAKLGSDATKKVKIPQDLADLTPEAKEKLKDQLALAAVLIDGSNKAATLGVSLMNANKASAEALGRPTLEDLVTGGKKGGSDG